MATNFVYCPNCSEQNTNFDSSCRRCGAMLPNVAMPMQPASNYGMQMHQPVGADKRIAAGICGILLGALGVHKFIMGYTTEGVIMLLVTLIGTIVLCGIPLTAAAMSIVGIIEGIMYLTKSDEEFSQTYFVNRKGWF